MDSPLPEGLVAEWERFFRQDHWKIDHTATIKAEIFSSPFLFPLQRKAELRKMLDVCKQGTKDHPIIMEIGADKGGGFYHLVNWLAPSAAICLELRGVPYAELFKQNFPGTEFLFEAGSSYGADVINSVDSFLNGRKIDVLFIDGDKSMFLRDFEVYVDHVRPGGIVLMHDVTDEAPGAAFERAKRHPRVTLSFTLIDKSDYDAERQRESVGLPERNPYEGWLRYWKGRSCGVGIIRV